MTFNFVASIVSPQHQRVAELVSEREEFHRKLPLSLWINNHEQPVDESWRTKLLSGTTSSWARWNEDEEQFHQISIRAKSELVTFGITDGFSSIEDVIHIAESLPFELAIISSPHEEVWRQHDYDRWGVGRSAIDHGLACIFRGAGHDRLASRRWLDFGPWRVIRRPNDTTVIQFHDLGLTDPAAAYEQAKLGHQLLGNSPLSGHINYHYAHVLQHAKAGLYVEETKTRHVVIPPRGELSPGDLLCETALRLHHRLTPGLPQPIETIAYTFFNPEEAEPHLHQLWLREIECWVIGRDDGKRHRLDLDYHPVPDPPDWVKRLEAR